MPTYEYQCDACGHAFEQFQSIKAAPVKKCPKCGKNKVKRLISAGAGLLFKGSGFYITDYRSDSYNKSAKADSGSDSSSSSSSSSGDSKPSGDAKPAGESKSSGSDAKPASDSKSSSSASSADKPAAPAKPEPKSAPKKSDRRK